MKRILPLAAVAISAMLVLSSCSTPEPAEKTPEGPTNAWGISTDAATTAVDTVSWGYYAKLPTLDPVRSLSREAGQIIGNLCDTLLLNNPDGTISDNLASLDRQDDTTYVLTLKDATFWDGSPVTAEDAAYSLNRNLDPAAISVFAKYYTNVTSIEATGDKEVTIKLSAPDILFEKSLATVASVVMQQEYSVAQGEQLGSLQGNLMCSGAFTIGMSDPASKIVLERNDDYWNDERAPLVKTLTIHFLQDGAAATAALASGEVQGMYNIPNTSFDSLNDSGIGKSYAGQSNIQFRFVVGALEGNPLDDVRLRQALSLAIDREAVAKSVYGNTGQAATGFYGNAVESTLPAPADGATFAPNADIDAAKALVDEVIEESGPQRAIKLSYTSGVGADVPQMALYLQQVAEQIGLEIELVDLPPGQWIEATSTAKTNPTFDLTFAYNGADISDPIAALLAYLPTDSSNYTDYDNALVTNAIADGRAALDDTERGTLARAAEAQLLKDLPSIPVVNTASLLFLNNDLTGIPLSAVKSFGYPWAAVLGGK